MACRFSVEHANLRGDSDPREQRLSLIPDSRVDRCERPVADLHRSVDQTIVIDRNGSEPDLRKARYQPSDG
jgi:hypothetical protein